MFSKEEQRKLKVQIKDIQIEVPLKRHELFC